MLPPVHIVARVGLTVFVVASLPVFVIVIMGVNQLLLFIANVLAGALLRNDESQNMLREVALLLGGTSCACGKPKAGGGLVTPRSSLGP